MNANLIEVTGILATAANGTGAQVKLGDGRLINAKFSRKARNLQQTLQPGQAVKVGLSPYNLNDGLIFGAGAEQIHRLPHA